MRSVSISHSEYLGDVVSSSSASTYANAVIGASDSTYPQLQINAGNAITFPWLSKVANYFIHYDFEDLVFEFQSTSAVALNSTNTQLGIIIARCEVNPTLPIDQNMSQLLNTHGHKKRMPYESWVIKFPRVGTRLIRTAVGTSTNNWGLTSNQDLRMYDQGWFNVASTGMQGTSVNLGQLHVHYTVRLMRPYLNLIASPSSIATYMMEWASGTNPTAAVPFGGVWRTAAAAVGVNTPGFSQNTTTITFPTTAATGTYWLAILTLAGTAGAVTFTADAALTGLSAVTSFYTTSTIDTTGTNEDRAFLVSTWRQTASTATANYANTFSAIPATVTTASIWITQINGDAVNNT